MRTNLTEMRGKAVSLSFLGDSFFTSKVVLNETVTVGVKAAAPSWME